MKKHQSSKNKKNEKILSINISTLPKQQILKLIAIRTKQKKRTVIFTPNTQILLKAQKSKTITNILNSSDINIPDGIGVVLASKLSGGKLNKRICGIDLAEDILQISQKNNYRVFLLGSAHGVAKKAKENLNLRYPNLNICGTHHGYFIEKDNEKIIKKINKSKADIIFVCLGSPTQEKWIIKNHKKLPSVKILIGLGGSLDVWSGKAHRAPTLFKILGLEWLYRTIKEPKRARIFLDIPIFLFKIWKNKNNAPFA
ncbi:MAG: WecB/TagA/CpsF family glycosyltransferase [Ruminococcaceae bacterium]|nr:WecB/TagA/CpsF family glycosyltransferase [Oscillospiraceae bacterium]